MRHGQFQNALPRSASNSISNWLKNTMGGESGGFEPFMLPKSNWKPRKLTTIEMTWIPATGLALWIGFHLRASEPTTRLARQATLVKFTLICSPTRSPSWLRRVAFPSSLARQPPSTITRALPARGRSLTPAMGVLMSLQPLMLPSRPAHGPQSFFRK